EQVAGPVRRRRLRDDAGTRDRPEAARDQRGEPREPRRGVEMGVDGAPGEVEPAARAEMELLEHRKNLRLVPLAPGRRVETQECRSGRPRRSPRRSALDHPPQPCATRGGIRPGWPKATGNGPRATWDVSIVSTPSRSTSIA